MLLPVPAYPKAPRMIFAFGNPVYDYIKTPALATGRRVLSGCSTNGCLALSRLGHATTLVGRIGEDYREQLVAELRRYGVSPAVEPCAETGGFSLIYDACGDRTLDVLGRAGAIDELPPDLTRAEAIIVGPILQETSPELIARIHAASDAPLLLDPQGLLRRIDGGGRIDHFCPPEFAALAPLFRVIKANELETRVLTGLDPRAQGAEATARLRALGCAIAIVTLAEAGSLIDDGQRQYRIPAYATEAKDPTGAGDTYLAGFLHAFLRDASDLYAAGCTGAATASIWIEHSGPDAPVTLAEVERRTASLLAGGHAR
jgi:sugar/nucleoside kinase (ribokinase family)